MAHSNRGRVILGGLLAGVVINLVEFVTNGLILKDSWAQVMQALGKSAPQGSAIVMFNIWGFLLGIAAVWVYAAIRPRYGAGPATAVRAGIVAWVLAVFLSDLTSFAIGTVPMRMLMVTGLVELIEIPIATVIGAWLYKEELTEISAGRRAAA